MKRKYPNKKKRCGFWKVYEQSGIKDFRKVWNETLDLIDERSIPFIFSRFGRKPNLSRKEYVCMAIMYSYFDLDFRELENILPLLCGKHLDSSNCDRWFEKLTPQYINELIFQVHLKIIKVNEEGDYIADSTKITCDRLVLVENKGEDIWNHETLKLHILAQYLFTIGFVSIVRFFPSSGELNDSPPLRDQLLQEGLVIKGKRLHADKGYFGKENLKKCREIELFPNIVPQERNYSDSYLKKYVQKYYDNEARKRTRGLIEGIFGGFETENYARIRCRKAKNRNIALGLLALKHNIRTYFRAITLKVLAYFATTPVQPIIVYIMLQYRCSRTTGHDKHAQPL